MTNQSNDSAAVYRSFHQLLNSVNDKLIEARWQLDSTSTPSEKQHLEDQIFELRNMRAHIDANMQAFIYSDLQITLSSPEVVSEIHRLAQEAEALVDQDESSGTVFKIAEEVIVVGNRLLLSLPGDPISDPDV
ncbi:MAG: hypothetical protein MN733_30295 [Nitrososphaera sp.]|nr:hypothetical protein [Nitrososphaera sp.]